MKGTNYLAAFGTVFLFIGFYCFKAAFQKDTSRHGSPPGAYGKVILIIAGILSISLGICLIVKAVSHIQ